MNDDYWFRAKRYGWGWGLPVRWQGWLVLGAFVGLIVVGSMIFPPRRELPEYLGLVFCLCIALIVVCWVKGERTRWRWGDDDRAEK